MENIRYDVNTVGELPDDHVEVCQYVRPNGRKRKVGAPLGKEYKEKVKEYILTCEVLMTGKVVVYMRHKTQDEEEEKLAILTNDDGPNGVIHGFKRFIDESIASIEKDLGESIGKVKRMASNINLP